MKFYKTDGLDALKSQLTHYTWTEEKKMKMNITTFADLELHTDGTLHLDGVSIRNKNREGDGLVACIPTENVYEFLESAAKLKAQLKKRGLYHAPKPTVPNP